MKIQLRTKLIGSFVMVTCITGFVATTIGVQLIGKAIVGQVQDKVHNDLNTARELYNEKARRLKDLLQYAAQRPEIRDALLAQDRQILLSELQRIRRTERTLDVLTLTDTEGRVVIRERNPEQAENSETIDDVVAKVLTKKEVLVATQIVPREELLKESADLARRAHIRFRETPHARSRRETEETSGMMIKAAAPILDEKGQLIGVLYGGTLLNQDFTLVDKIVATVYQDVKYKGKEIGTATLFQDDLRISTNVHRDDGTRAVGTRVSKEVYDAVVRKGQPWIARAFVVNAWYRTAYEPIRDIQGKIIGILYVGVLEEPYIDFQHKILWAFLGITFAGMVAALVVSYFLADGIVQPVQHLMTASKQLAEGNLGSRVEISRTDEIGELGKTFNRMAASLHERDIELKQLTQEKLMETSHLAMLGQLAAGVAHEINNPLGGILLYSNLLLENPPDDSVAQKNLARIVQEATRCKRIVKGLLDFARQSKPEKEPNDLNILIDRTLALIENQSAFHNIQIQRKFAASLPSIIADGRQLQQVFMNIILNAADAMQDGGTLTVSTWLLGDGDRVEARFEDTGCGIKPEHIPYLFDPFFTTKEVGKGTGLGLSISYGIVEAHGGRLHVESELGKGSVFCVLLPVQTETS